MNYELFYLIGASEEAQIPDIKKRVENIITESGGEFSEKETFEKRRLSYKVKRDTHGIYIARRFNLEDIEKLKDINQKLNLDSGVLRFIISRADELPELKSKEERMAETAKKETPREPRRKEKKPEEKKPREIEKIKTEDKDESETAKEDIDKKLEEILNI